VCVYGFNHSSFQLRTITESKSTSSVPKLMLDVKFGLFRNQFCRSSGCEGRKVVKIWVWNILSPHLVVKSPPASGFCHSLWRKVVKIWIWNILSPQLVVTFLQLQVSDPGFRGVGFGYFKGFTHVYHYLLARFSAYCLHCIVSSQAGNEWLDIHLCRIHDERFSFVSFCG